MKKAIEKYGWNNIEHIILFSNLTKEEANLKEEQLIEEYETTNREKGYNISAGGEYTGRLYTEKNKQEILALWNTGLSISEIAKKINISFAFVSNTLYEKGISSEEIEARRREKIGIAEKRYSEEEIIELFRQGWTVKDIAEKLGCCGFTITTALNKSNLFSKKERRLRGKAKPVNQYTLEKEYIKTWECAADANEAITGKRAGGHITEVCNGRRRQAYGYFWEFTNLENKLN